MLTVQFDGSSTDDDYFPVRVENIEEHLHEEGQSQLVDASAADVAASLKGTPPEAAIDAALEIIHAAPTFDHIESGELEAQTETISVEYQIDVATS